MNAERLFKESDAGLENADIFRKPAGEGHLPAYSADYPYGCA
jgi:hypothetical protein